MTSKPMTCRSVTAPLIWALLMIPFGIVAFDIGLGLRKRYLDANAAELRASRAFREARVKLKRALRSADAAPAVAVVVREYLEDKTNRSLFGVPQTALAQLLVEKGITEGLIQDTMVLLLGGKVYDFAGLPASATEEGVADAALVLTALEQEWRD